MKRSIISFLVGAIVTACAMGWFWYQDREQYTRAIPAVKGPVQVAPVANGTPAGATNGAVPQQTGTATPQQAQITQEKAMEIFKGSIINVGGTPLRCHFQHYFFAKK